MGKKIVIPQKFSQKPMKKYIVSKNEYERYGDSGAVLTMHKAPDLKTLLEKVCVNWVEGMKEEIEDEGKVWKGLTPKLIKEMDSRNGDGDDYYEIYEITPKDELKCVFGAS